jgi:hypothetical protein
MANGAPALLNQITGILNRVTLLIADAVRLINAFRGSGWGIYNQKGELILYPDSISALDYQRNFEIMTYPVEKGGFQSYNKVQLPFETSVEMTKGGTVADKVKFITRLELLVASLDLVTVVTPEQYFENCNLESFDYSRDAANGAGLMTFNLQLKEVRATVVRTTTNTKNPNSAASTQSGTVQASSSPSAPATT